ncbi:MAG: hypothetical protein Tsb0013_20360 [Phycisphaerales bacterium]
MTRQFKNRPFSVRFAMMTTVISVVTPFGGFWSQGVPAAEADTRAAQHSEVQPAMSVAASDRFACDVAMVD